LAVGGLVGWNLGGSVLDCYSTGDVTGDSSGVGGIVGRNNEWGTVSNCYSAGDADSIWGAPGGVVGSSSLADVLNCFWDVEKRVDGLSDSIGTKSGSVKNDTGLPTAQMQTKSTFTSAGWDFDEVWDLGCEGMNYPRLVWEIPAGDSTCPHGIDWRDFPFFVEHWMETFCGGRNICGGMDFDSSGAVDGGDLQILFNRWLDGVGQ